MKDRLLWALGILALVLVPASVWGQTAPPSGHEVEEGPPPAQVPAEHWAFPDVGQLADLPQHAWDLLSQTPQPGHPAPFADHYRVTWFPDANVSGQNANLGFVRQELGVVCPLWKDDCNALGLTAGVRSVLFHTTAELPGTGLVFPQELWDVRFGVNYKHTFDNGWSTGATVTVGSASDQPFSTVDELTASVMAFLRIPVGEHNAWIFSVMYSPTGEVPFPIPGIAFYWQPSPTFNATIGVPFKLEWKPVDGCMFEASYMPLTSVRVRGSYRLWGGVSVYAGYDNTNEAYFLAHRTDSNDRFFIFDQRVTTGVKMEFGPHVCLDLSGGYAFDRHFTEGHNFSDNSHRVDVENTPFLSLMFEIRY
jgi:hypothetical protein